MGAPLYCSVCHDEVTLGGQLLPTGPVCADCAANAPEIVATSRAIAKVFDVPESLLGLAVQHKDVDPVTTDGAPLELDVLFGPLQFRPPKYAKQLSLSIEEWFYLGSRIVATPHELNLTGKFLAAMSADPEFDVRFVVVLSWQSIDEQNAPWRDIGPTFSIAEGFNGNRAAALQAATTEARTQAKRLKAVGPFGYVPARQINN